MAPRKSESGRKSDMVPPSTSGADADVSVDLTGSAPLADSSVLGAEGKQKDATDSKEPKDPKDAKDSKDSKEHREPRESLTIEVSAARPDIALLWCTELNGIHLQDLNLPKSIVTRLAKGVLAPTTQIQGNAMVAISKSATVFINYLASQYALSVPSYHSLVAVSPILA